MEALEQQNLTDPGALLRLHTSLVAGYFERGAYGRASASAAEERSWVTTHRTAYDG